MMVRSELVLDKNSFYGVQFVHAHHVSIVQGSSSGDACTNSLFSHASYCAGCHCVYTNSPAMTRDGNVQIL